MLTDSQLVEKGALARDTFTPGSPINIKNLFAGRIEQLMEVIEGISRPGQHVVVFGERGVGKTSLGNIVKAAPPFSEDICAVKVNCSEGESFSNLWKAIFREVEMTTTYRKYPTLNDELKYAIQHLVDKDNATTITPDDARFILAQLPTRSIVFIDELDSLNEPKTLALLADTIKTLSDYTVPSTLILIGVGDSIGELLAEHASIARSLTQVHMPRMSSNELTEIVEKGIERLGMTTTSGVKNKIVQFSLGLPHYTHLLALESVLAALSDRRLNIQDSDFDVAVEKALQEKKENTAIAYYNATDAPRGKHYPIILCACAIAKTDDRGNFSPVEVGKALKKLTKKEWHPAQFSRHLREFSTEKRGNVLIESGSERRYRYKFRDPLLQPYIILKGVSDRRISPKVAEEVNNH